MPHSPSSDDAPGTSQLAALVPPLRTAFLRHNYTVSGLEDALGAAGIAALARSDAAALARRAKTLGPLGELLRLFVLGDAIHRDTIANLIPDLDLAAAVRCGLLIAGEDPEELKAGLDLRPADTGRGPQWVFSDIDGSMVHNTTRPDHVLGVGQASMSLLGITVPGPAESVLDLGTGCGIQLIASEAQHRVGTDITPRCLDFAAATCAINGIEAELLEGPWFTPVAERKFSRIVANPPFVIGTPTIAHSYRESGLHLDGATRTVISNAGDYLEPEGIASMLGSWVVRETEDWRQRLASWLPEQGVCAWVLMRDLTDPEHYVWTWLTDEGADPRDAEYRDAAQRWLDHLDAEDVAGIGFGFIYLQAIDGPSEIVCEELSHDFDAGLGAEAAAHFRRSAWLRQANEEILDATVFTVAPGVVLHAGERLDAPDINGYADEVGDGPASGNSTNICVVERTSGPRWRHDLDEPSAAILRGIANGVLPLSEIAALAALGFDLDDEATLPAVRVLAVDLMRHGIIVPRDLAGTTFEEHLSSSPGFGGR